MINVTEVKNLLKDSNDIKSKKELKTEKVKDEENFSFQDIFTKEIKLDELSEKKAEKDIENKINDKRNETKIEKDEKERINLEEKEKNFNNTSNKFEIKLSDKKNNIEIINKNINKNKSVKELKIDDNFHMAVSAHLKGEKLESKNSKNIMTKNQKANVINSLKSNVIKKENGKINENLKSVAFKEKNVVNNLSYSTSKKEEILEKSILAEQKNNEMDKKIKNSITQTKNILKEKRIFVEQKETEAHNKNIQKNELLLNTNNDLKKSQTMIIEKTPEPSNLQQTKDFVFDQIAKNTKIFLTDNKTSFSTMIRPDNIGRVDFKFLIKDGKAIGKLIVHNNDAFEFFRSNVVDLKAVFEKANVELENLDIILAGNKFSDTNNEGKKESKNEIDENFAKLNFAANKTFVETQFQENMDILNTNYFNFFETKINLVI